MDDGWLVERLLDLCSMNLYVCIFGKTIPSNGPYRQLKRHSSCRKQETVFLLLMAPCNSFPLPMSFTLFSLFLLLLLLPLQPKALLFSLLLFLICLSLETVAV